MREKPVLSVWARARAYYIALQECNLSIHSPYNNQLSIITYTANPSSVNYFRVER